MAFNVPDLRREMATFSLDLVELPVERHGVDSPPAIESDYGVALGVLAIKITLEPSKARTRLGGAPSGLPELIPEAGNDSCRVSHEALDVSPNHGLNVPADRLGGASGGARREDGPTLVLSVANVVRL